MEPVNLKISNRIRELRKINNITQAKLAEIADVDYRHIQLLESKKPSASKITTVEKLAKAFKMSLSEFLDF